MRKTLPLTLVFLGLVAGTAIAQRATAGEVVAVIDGKTIALATDTGRTIVELQYVDVPLQGAMAETVKSHLKLLAMGRKAVYTPRVIRDDRSAGILEIGGVDMAGQMLRDGAAWHVPSQLSGQPAGEADAYASLEGSAKIEKRGIWSDASLLPPWQAPYKAPVSEAIIASGAVGDRPHAPARNPRMGDTGFLLNGYDPGSRTGYLSTSLMGIGMDENPYDQRMALDISYYYKEDERYRRTGSFVLTLITDSPKAMFDRNNALMLYGGGPAITMPVARRFVQIYEGRVFEKMLYRLDRSVINRLTNSDAAYLKMRNNTIVATTGRYWLYALLQVTG
jgi:endonuclease YncB( thermonuclease family)